MKQVLADLRTGTIEVRDVPAPAPRPGFVLVRTSHSLISAGTEGATLKLGKMGPLAKAKARPEQALKLIELARAQGPLAAYKVAQRALDMPVALGYSCAGVIESVGEGCGGLRPGQRVACAGQGWASHAEFVSVPRRLCVPIPDAVPNDQAAFAAVGAIALQSLRIADCRLGESVVVIGLGLVGLLVAQLARAAGCKVVGLDIDQERLTQFAGNAWGTVGIADQSAKGLVDGATMGRGADAVVVTAATDSEGPVSLAGELCRRKGRVVVVGRTPMVAPRESFLFKELSLLPSMAAGPGTGDPCYEEAGLDYPLPYVRFTEERNMEAFLDQLAAKRVDVTPLITHRFPVDAAQAAFQALVSREQPATAILLEYQARGEYADHLRVVLPPRQHSIAPAVGKHKMLRLGVIGAGSFATHELLPVLRGLPVELLAIASLTGVRAEALARSHGFGRCTSDTQDVLQDPNIDAVLVLTRHDTHAELAAAALTAGKHVFVEKPLALDRRGLEGVRNAQTATGRLLMVGFNRRFAPQALKIRGRFERRTQPIFVRYLANVGRRPPEHWLHDPRKGGGVILGEACHHLDFCCWLVNRAVFRVEVQPLGLSAETAQPLDSVAVTLCFEDGSVATVGYMSNGNRRFPAETIDVLCAGEQARLLDFRVLESPGRFLLSRARSWLAADKGHAGQLRRFVMAALGIEPAFDVTSYFDSSELAIEVFEAASRNARHVDIAGKR